MADVIEHDRLFIGGRWVAPAGGDTITVVSPHTEEVIGRVPHAGPADVDAAVAAAREAFDHGPWPRMSVDERIEIVLRMKDGLAARAPRLAALISSQNGSPITWAATGQVMSAIAVYGTTAGVAREFPFEEWRHGMGGPLLVRNEPVGVVAAVVPWNVPQFVTATKVAPALVSGCTVVLKASPETPLDAFVLAEVAEAAGLPAGVLNVLPADRETSSYLVAHPDVDKVAFTGSVAAGQKVMASAAENLHRVTLELGGKSAAVILEDADLTQAVPALMAGSYMNNGQACIALTRILVPDSRYDEISAALTAAVSALKVGDPLDPGTQVGPLVTKRQQERSLEYIRIAREEGATLLTGGGVPETRKKGWYVEPTLFGDVGNDMRIAREEVFGPVVVLIRYQDEDDAVRIANDSDFGLSGAVWAGDTEHGLDVARRIRTGTLSVNTLRVDFLGPFGGFKKSGVGREFGVEGLRSYLEPKAVYLPQSTKIPQTKRNTMRAAILQQTGDETLDVREDVTTRPVGPGLVRIRMRAASLCHSDVSGMNGTLALPTPFVPGHEGAGVIAEVGEGVTHVSPGDRVVVCWMPPCGQCGSCKRGEGNLCLSGMASVTTPVFASGGEPVFGFIGTGTFAEEIVVSGNAAVPLPDDVPFEIGALIGCGVTTGIGAALHTAEVKPGSRVAVIGCGGVGISVVQGAKVAGATTIVAVDPVAGRRDWARELGATHSASPEEFAKLTAELTGGEGFDYVFEAVGKPATVRTAYDATRRGGTLCLVGVGAKTEFPRINLSELVMHEKKLLPSFYGGTDVLKNFAQIIELWRAGEIDLEKMITHRVPLTEANEAVRQMHTGEALRTVLTIG
ncbi:aldehyde dehydrogenase family protein [Streptomyces sp. NPDC004726]